MVLLTVDFLISVRQYGLKAEKILIKEMQKSLWLKHNTTLCYSHVEPSSDVPGMVTLLRSSLPKKINIQAVPVL